MKGYRPELWGLLAHSNEFASVHAAYALKKSCCRSPREECELMDDEPDAVSASDQSKSDSTADAASATRRSTVVAVLVVGLVFIIVAGGVALSGVRVPPSTGESVISNGDPTHRVVFENGRGETLGVFDVWVAETRHEQIQGLSGTNTLPSETGLLFAYDEEAADRAIVMREMNYPIDVVFIDGSGAVTTVHSATPEPGVAEADLTHYTGRARWILELPHQSTERYSITAGTSVRITGPTHTFEPISAATEQESG